MPASYGTEDPGETLNKNQTVYRCRYICMRPDLSNPPGAAAPALGRLHCHFLSSAHTTFCIKTDAHQHSATDLSQLTCTSSGARPVLSCPTVGFSDVSCFFSFPLFLCPLASVLLSLCPSVPLSLCPSVRIPPSSLHHVDSAGNQFIDRRRVTALSGPG